MLRARTIALGVPLLVVSGIAAQVIFSTKITGNTVAAHFSDSFSSVDVTPVDSPDGTAYFVFWQSCTFNPDFDHRICVFEAGLAPKSAINAQQVGRIELDVDISSLSVISFLGGDDCTTGTCVSFTPSSVPLKGSFTILQGPGSYSQQSNGSSRREDISFFGGAISSMGFSGSKVEYSANFAGTVGDQTVTPPPIGFNGSLTIMKGQQTFQLVYPPVY